MPLPKAPTKPATLLQTTDDLIAKPNRNKKSSGRGLAPQEDAEPGLMAGPAARAPVLPPLPQAPAPAPAARTPSFPIPPQTAPAPAMT
ncbi:MAG: hypothetical protein ACKOCR_03850, partial [Burkholderiaceae bacterium]